MKSPRNPGLDFMLDLARLATESGGVIGLRLALVAQGGGRAQSETALMIKEKAQAIFDAQVVIARSLLEGQPHLAAARALVLYRRRVRANHRRLIRGA